MMERRRAAGDTHPGLQRANNEDRFFFDDRRGVYCVIDGVGGHNAGERAAEIAAETIRTLLAAPALLTNSRLRDSLARANDAIFDAALRNTTLNGMACVATLAVVDTGRCRYAHVGDTRLYKIRAGRIDKVTRDHSPVGELEDAGSLSEIEAMRHPRRNEIYRDLGSKRFGGPDVIEVGEVLFEPDAALVLCSDGLSDQVSAGSVRRIVESFAGSPALAVQELIAAANDAGGKDNVTVLVVEGENFAAAASTRAAGRPVPSGALPPRPMPQQDRDRIESGSPAAFRPISSIELGRSRRVWLRAALALATGLVVGAALGVAAERSGLVEDVWQRYFASTRAPRTWQVGLHRDADFATIGEALRSAAAGDTVAIAPGEYREDIAFKSGVIVDAAPGSVLKAPLGASASFTAVTIRDAASGRLSGLTIAGSAEQPIGTGILVERSSVVLEDLDVSGAASTGVVFGAGGQPVLRGSFLHDNRGPAVAVRERAEPRLERNVIVQNSPPGAPAVMVESGARPTLVGNGLSARGGPAVQGWPAAALSDLVRQNVVSPEPLSRPAAEGRRPGPRPR